MKTANEIYHIFYSIILKNTFFNQTIRIEKLDNKINQLELNDTCAVRSQPSEQ